MPSFHARVAVNAVEQDGINGSDFPLTINSVVDDIADISAILRLAIVGVQSVEDEGADANPATLASVITSLCMAEHLLCGIHNRCDRLAIRVAR